MILSGSNFDTLLAVYTGTAVNALKRVASNDNCTLSGGFPAISSCVTFSVTQGVTYSLQVDGVGGTRGSFRIGAIHECVLR